MINPRTSAAASRQPPLSEHVPVPTTQLCRSPHAEDSATRRSRLSLPWPAAVGATCRFGTLVAPPSWLRSCSAASALPPSWLRAAVRRSHGGHRLATASIHGRRSTFERLTATWRSRSLRGERGTFSGRASDRRAEPGWRERGGRRAGAEPWMAERRASRHGECSSTRPWQQRTSDRTYER